MAERDGQGLLRFKPFPVIAVQLITIRTDIFQDLRSLEQFRGQKQILGVSVFSGHELCRRLIRRAVIQVSEIPVCHICPAHVIYELMSIGFVKSKIGRAHV